MIKTRQDGSKFITSEHDGAELAIDHNNIARNSVDAIIQDELSLALSLDKAGAFNDTPHLAQGLCHLNYNIRKKFNDNTGITQLRPQTYGEHGSFAHTIATHINEVIQAHNQWNQNDSSVEPL